MISSRVIAYTIAVIAPRHLHRRSGEVSRGIASRVAAHTIAVIASRVMTYTIAVIASRHLHRRVLFVLRKMDPELRENL